MLAYTVSANCTIVLMVLTILTALASRMMNSPGTMLLAQFFAGCAAYAFVVFLAAAVMLGLPVTEYH